MFEIGLIHMSKVTSNSSFQMNVTVQYSVLSLDLRCSGVEVKVLEIGCFRFTRVHYFFIVSHPGTQPTRPKTHCEHHRDSGPEPFPVVGAFVPQCDAEGQYIPLQV